MYAHTNSKIVLMISLGEKFNMIGGVNFLSLPLGFVYSHLPIRDIQVYAYGIITDSSLIFSFKACCFPL